MAAIAGAGLVAAIDRDNHDVDRTVLRRLATAIVDCSIARAPPKLNAPSIRHMLHDQGHQLLLGQINRRERSQMRIVECDEAFAPIVAQVRQASLRIAERLPLVNVFERFIGPQLFHEVIPERQKLFIRMPRIYRGVKF
jgi:hypothetical protein